VWQHVASVNGSIEIHGEQQVERHVWRHVASVKALLDSLKQITSDQQLTPPKTKRGALYLSLYPMPYVD